MSAPSATVAGRRPGTRRPALSFLRWTVLALAVLALNFPVLATLATSFKGPAEISSNPGLTVREPTLENYRRVFEVTDRLDIGGYLLNSTVASLIGAALPVLVAFPAAWAMARRGVGRRLLLPTIVNLRVLPLVVFAIPLYMMYQWAGLLDTRLGLGLVLAVVNLPLTLVLLVNAVGEVPIELEEAARADGVRTGPMLVRVVAPLCLPAIGVAFVFGFVTAWNEFLFGLILTTVDAVPVTVGASFFFSAGGGGVQWGVAAAVMIVAAAPPMLLGLALYRRIGTSLGAGAIKG